MRVHDVDGDDLGIAHAPWPVDPGDVLALKDGPPLVVVGLVELPDGAAFDALCRVEPA